MCRYSFSFQDGSVVVFDLDDELEPTEREALADLIEKEPYEPADRRGVVDLISESEPVREFIVSLGAEGAAAATVAAFSYVIRRRPSSRKLDATDAAIKAIAEAHRVWGIDGDLRSSEFIDRYGCWLTELDHDGTTYEVRIAADGAVTELTVRDDV